MTDPVRKIIHIDMDAFFASVEQRDDPSLRGRPVAVGGERARGVVAAASYEARKYGVRSAMPSSLATKKCPDLVFVKPRFEAYRAVSEEVREIFAEYTDLVEPVSIDEAYLDVTENHPDIPYATTIAREIRDKVRERTSLTCSAGVSYNKFLAKMASDMDKPDGMYVILPGAAEELISALPVGRFHGIGQATEAKMHGFGIRTGADLRGQDEDFLIRNFGKAGRHYYLICRGIDHRTVNPDRVRKSYGAETTFDTNIDDAQSLKDALRPLVDKVWKKMADAGHQARKVALKVKYANFHQITRVRSFPSAFTTPDEAYAPLCSLVDDLFPLEMSVRLIGLSFPVIEDDASNREGQENQLTLSL